MLSIFYITTKVCHKILSTAETRPQNIRVNPKLNKETLPINLKWYLIDILDNKIKEMRDNYRQKSSMPGDIYMFIFHPFRCVKIKVVTV